MREAVTDVDGVSGGAQGRLTMFRRPVRGWRAAAVTVTVAVAALGGLVGCAGDDSDGPTGRVVLFGSPEMLLVPAAGGRPERFGIGEREFWDLAFAPDGNRVAFIPARGIESDGITIMNLKEGQTTVIPNQPPQDQFGSYDMAWAPDGKSLAFVNGADVYVVSIDGTGLRRVGRGDSPSWALDGTRIVFSSGDNRGDNLDLAVVRADGTGLRVLGRGQHPDVSPSGEMVAYSTRTGIFVRALAGGESRLVVPNGFDPVWSPDGKFLAFTRYTECGHAACSGRVFVVPVEGGAPHAIGPTMGDPGGPRQWIR